MEATTAAQIMDILERYVFNLANLQAMLRLSTNHSRRPGDDDYRTTGILNIAGEGTISVALCGSSW